MDCVVVVVVVVDGGCCGGEGLRKFHLWWKFRWCCGGGCDGSKSSGHFHPLFHHQKRREREREKRMWRFGFSIGFVSPLILCFGEFFAFNPF